MSFIAYRTCTKLFILGLALVATGFLEAAPATPSLGPLDQAPDSIGENLREQMIWAPTDVKLQSANVAFRKRFTLETPPTQATLYLFADVRYLLWINGEYVLRGPARFNPKGPEYDVAEVKAHLHSGDNEIVVLVLADQSNGKMMHCWVSIRKVSPSTSPA